MNSITKPLGVALAALFTVVALSSPASAGTSRQVGVGGHDGSLTTGAVTAVSARAAAHGTQVPPDVTAQARWRPTERYFFYIECLAAGVAATVGPGAFAMDYDCQVDSNPNYYRLWLLF